MNTVKFYTLGCKVNQYDTQSIRERFLSRGFKEICNGACADIYIINTCTVTADADRKSRNIIRHCVRLKNKGKVIVTGCLAEKDVRTIAEIQGVDLIISKRFFRDGISGFGERTRAFIKVQDGCNNRCSYCKIPLARGASRSRSTGDIVSEARKVVACGYKEIVLTGICLGAYQNEKKDKNSLVRLLTELEKISGLLRIRLSSIEAADVNDDLIGKMADSEKLCPHLHIPIQSGDDHILKMMNRSYTRRAYLNLIDSVKKSVPDVAITTDIMVGFPGEEEVNFNNTLDLIREVRPLRTHIFPFSPRKGTQAYSLNNRPRPLLVKERLEVMRAEAEKCSYIFKKNYIGKNMEVLFETASNGEKSLWGGYTRNYIPVFADSPLDLTNKIAHLKISKVIKNGVLAEFY